MKSSTIIAYLEQIRDDVELIDEQFNLFEEGFIDLTAVKRLRANIETLLNKLKSNAKRGQEIA